MMTLEFDDSTTPKVTRKKRPARSQLAEVNLESLCFAAKVQTFFLLGLRDFLPSVKWKVLQVVT